MFDFLNSRLSLSLRVGLVAACAAPPIALLLYLFIGQTLQTAQFIDLELKGAAYIAEIWPAIISGGDLVLPSSAPDAEEASRRFHASDAEKTFLAAGKSRRISAGAALLQAVADGSNLTLDTDLGSFYAMDAATVALPRLMSVLSSLDTASDPKAQASALGHSQAYEDAALRDLNETIAHDSTGGGRRVLGALPNQLSEAFAALSSHPDNPALRAALIGEVDRVWRADQGQLVHLLQARQARLYRRFLRNLGLVALALGLTAALTIATTRGLAARLRVLLRTMDRLNVRDTTADIPYLSDRNETGRIAATLEAFKTGLIEADQERQRAAEANAAVRESEAQLRVLTENMSDIIIRIDKDGRRIFVSASIRRFGYEPEELLGQPGFSTVHPDDRPIIDTLVERLRQGDRSASEATFESRLKSGAGDWTWMEGKANPIYGADGELVEIIWLLRDIQARKLAQDAIAESEARYRMLADNATDIIVHQDLDFRVLYISPSGRRHALAENLNKSAIDFIHPDDQAQFVNRRREVQAGRPGQVLEGRVRLANGDWVWVDSTLTPVHGDDGELTGYITTVREITGRKAAEQALIESEARYRMLADTSTDIIIRYDANSRIEYVSPSVRQLGYTPEEFSALPPGSHAHPDDWPKIVERRAAIFRGEPIGTTEARMRHADGHWVWLENSPAPVHDENGAVIGMVSMLRDITKRKAAELDLIQSEARYRMLADHASDVIVHQDLNFNIKYLSPSARRYGIDPDAYVGTPTLALIHPDDLELAARRREEAKAGRQVKAIEGRIRFPGGDWNWIETTLTPVQAEDGSITGFITTLRDIGERKAAEAALIRSEARYRMLADNSTDVILLYNLESTIDYVSPSVRQWGYRPEDFVGRPAGFFVHPEDSDRVAARRQSLLRGEPGGVLEARVRCADGRWIWIESNPAQIHDDEGRPAGLLVAMRDITERKAAEQALIDSEARYRMLADNSTDIIYSYGPDARTEYISPSVRQLGYTPEEFASFTHGVIIHPEDWPRLAERGDAIFRGEPGRTVEARVRHADGHWVWLESRPAPIRDDTGAVVGIVSILRDISERKAAEGALQEVNAELSRIARASALGAFAASIAHEVNQPLAAAVIDGETSLRWLSGDEPNLDRAARAIHRATDNARRASEVVGRLRAMVVKEQTQRADFELNKAIGEVLSLTARESLRSNITVTADLAPEGPVVRGDRIQVQQVILNLVLNAIEAVRDTPEGDRQVCVRSSTQPNGDVEITVEDRGSGVSPDNAERIFDNLFTTKIGGTGLGLPISKSIVEAHGGRMWVENAVPQGAVFKVHLPQGREDDAQPSQNSRETVPAP